MRKLFSASIPCKGGCKYCFAKWANYTPQMELSQEIPNVDTESIILYPCCDGDCFNQINLFEQLMQLKEVHQKVYISISSKSFPSDEQITELKNLHQWLVQTGNGYLKFAISLSNRSMLEEIEPMTMPYEERVNLASKINAIGIPLSLTIKPILPFIPEIEYKTILSDFQPYLKHVLLGGLYVDKESDFFHNYLSNYECTKRKVSWLPNTPEWDYIEDSTLIENLQNYAHKLGIKTFLSDNELMESLANEVMLQNGYYGNN